MKKDQSTQLILDKKDYPSIVSNMIVDKAGDIWVSYYGQGLFRFVWEGNELKEVGHFFKNSEQFTAPSSYAVNDMIQDEQGRLWFATTDGLFYYEKTTERISFFEPIGVRPIFSFCQEQGEQYLLGGRNGIFRLDFSKIICRKSWWS